jgi:cephalosporin hydroxylase
MNKQIDLIKKCDFKKLTNQKYLEFDLLPKLGLNDRHKEQYPYFLQPNCGKGLKSWQYPSQFSKYLIYISKLNIKSYVEIGCHKGGTLIITVEYLSRFTNLDNVLCVDNWPRSQIKKYCKQKNFSYNVCSSQDKKFQKKFLEKQWDLVFIDGNHSYDSVELDYELAKQSSKYIVLHDICNDLCPGVKKFWQKIKNNKCKEWKNQYKEIKDKYQKKIMGIGLIPSCGG